MTVMGSHIEENELSPDVEYESNLEGGGESKAEKHEQANSEEEYHHEEHVIFDNGRCEENIAELLYSDDSSPLSTNTKTFSGGGNVRNIGGEACNSVASSRTNYENGGSQEMENCGKWSELPSLPIENVYSFLSRTDQCRMSLVCKRWAKDYGSPSIWKTVKFYLPEHECLADICPEVKFARKYGSMFRNVEIICKRIKLHLLGEMVKQLKLFLQSLSSHSQLHSIKFINLGRYFRRLEDFIREDVYQAISNFIGSQNNLITVEFTDCYFKKLEGMELLKTLMNNSDGHLIRQLSLYGFVTDPANPDDCSRTGYFDDVNFNVKSLETDYTFLFEELFSNMSSRAHNEIEAGGSKINVYPLTDLSISCDGIRHTFYRGLSPVTWKNMLKLCPELKVSLDLTSHSNVRRELAKFIVVDLPLRTLDFCFDKCFTTPRAELSVLFDHLLLCKCNESLEVVNVVWMPHIPDLNAAIGPFLQACQKLQTFYLRTYSGDGIEALLISLLEYRPVSLKSITLWFMYTSTEEQNIMINDLSEQYYPLLQGLGIEMFLIIDPSRRRTRRN